MAEKICPYPKPKPRDGKPIRFRKNSYGSSAPDTQAPLYDLPAHSAIAFPSGVPDFTSLTCTV